VRTLKQVHELSEVLSVPFFRRAELSMRGCRPGVSMVTANVAFLLAASLAVLTVGTALVARAPAADAQTSSLSNGFGVYPGNGGIPQAQTFSTFEGAPVHWVTAYLTGGTGWSSVDDPSSSSLTQWTGSDYKVDWSVPIINESGETLAQGAAGDFNEHFLKMGDAFVAAGETDAVFRLGWEFGGSDMPWSAGSDPTAFAQYWQQIVTTLRTIPGQHFKFDWNGGGGSSWPIAEAYPGDTYVDYVTGDVYDQSWDPATGYGDNTATAAGYQAAWKDWLPNLNWMARFANEHGKPLGFPEWGDTIRSDGHGGGDDPYYIQQMYVWMSTHNVAFEMYFEFDAPDGLHDLQDGNFPASAAVFQELFKTPAPSVSFPTATLVVSCPTGTTGSVGGAAVTVAAVRDRDGCDGYRVASAGGSVTGFGAAPDEGSIKGALTAPIISMVTTPNQGGYWLLAADGGVFAFGDAAFFGSTGGQHLNQPIVGMTPTADGGGYWLVAKDGGVFAFGDARFHGSMGGQHLNQPVVGVASSVDGQGYYLVSSDGGVFTFGDARFHGSMGGTPLNGPVIGISTDPQTGGYRMVAQDGGVFDFDAQFFGSLAGNSGAPVVSLAPTSDLRGYYLLRRDGSLAAFGDAALLG
jgi:hypothetical protein